jgi:hypothetical protein
MTIRELLAKLFERGSGGVPKKATENEQIPNRSRWILYLAILYNVR